MKKIVFCSYLIISCFNVFAQSSPCKEIVGYYPNWQWYDRNKLVNPQTIDYSKYTILNYSFFEPLASGSIKITDPWADKNLLLGPINWAVAPAGYDTAYDFGNPAYHVPGLKMSDICHQHNVTFLPSIGGWTLSQNFPTIAADPAKRQVFAQSCVSLIQAFGFDGIDLDWEYPGFADHGGTAQDKVNFTLLLNDVRTAIDNYGQSVGKEMLLTIAVSADPSKMDDVEWQNVSPLVDMINLMSYDFFGAFDSFTNHNAPLFAPQVGNAAFNADAAITSLHTQYSVSSEKINLGIPFYGRSQKTNSAPQLQIPSTGAADLITFQVDEGTPLYYNVLLTQQLFTRHWDNTAKVPYLLGNNGLNTFLSYDDEESVGLKAQYVIEKNLKGAIIWEITGDYIETAPGSGIISHTPLVDSINNVFCNYNPSDTTGGGSGGGTSSLEEINDVYSLGPNPFSDHITLNFIEAPTAIHFTNALGQAIQVRTINSSTSTTFETAQLVSGVYFISVDINGKSCVFSVYKN